MGDEGTLEEGFILEDVNTALKSFGEKAPGALGIAKMYLTQASENIRRTLTMVYNVALALGHFPGRFKHAQVVMIPKTKCRNSWKITFFKMSSSDSEDFVGHNKQLKWPTRP